MQMLQVDIIYVKHNDQGNIKNIELKFQVAGFLTPMFHYHKETNIHLDIRFSEVADNW